MKNEDDWEELRKWEESRKQSNIDNYKIDINATEELQGRRKKMDKVYTPIDNTLKRLKRVLIGTGIIVGILAVIVFLGWWNDAGNYINPDIDSYFKIHQGVRVKVISKEVDEHENGKYILASKNYPDIQFTAIKKWGNVQEDFEDNYQKYLFNHWESNRKEYFSFTEEVDEQGLLHYQNYVIVNENKIIDEATEDFISFLEYEEKWNMENKVIEKWQQKRGEFVVPRGHISIQIEENNISPYTALWQTADEIRENVKNELLRITSQSTQKGYQLFGKDYCTTDHSLEAAGDALTEWKCQLCGRSAINSDTNVPQLCDDCARITGRCHQCGKLKK